MMLACFSNNLAENEPSVLLPFRQIHPLHAPISMLDHRHQQVALEGSKDKLLNSYQVIFSIPRFRLDKHRFDSQALRFY